MKMLQCSREKWQAAAALRGWADECGDFLPQPIPIDPTVRA
jgi:hypothetical protein